LLAPGTTTELNIDVAVSDAARPSIINTAIVTTTGDVNITNNVAVDYATVEIMPAEVPEADTLWLLLTGGSGLGAYLLLQWQKRFKK